jgi:hypothetical protein
MKPVEPWDSHGRVRDTRVTLFINGINCGSRLVPLPAPNKGNVQTWTADAGDLCEAASRGQELRLRFEVEPTADMPYGINIANFPFDSKGVAPIEVEVRTAPMRSEGQGQAGW